MIGELAGDQWNEGDVSDSVVRRVALPDAFFAADGLFQTFLTVLDEFGAFPAVIQRELDRYLPFLATTKVLMAAVRNGVGRESRPRGDQGGRGRGRARHAARAGRERRLRPARRRRAARAHRRAAGLAGGRADHVHRRRGRPGRRPSYAGSTPSSRATPTPRRTPPATSCSGAAGIPGQPGIPGLSGVATPDNRGIPGQPGIPQPARSRLSSRSARTAIASATASTARAVSSAYCRRPARRCGWCRA